MNARSMKAHLLNDVFLQKPCWKNNRILCSEMKHAHESFKFQLGCIQDPIKIIRLHSLENDYSKVEIQLSKYNKFMLTTFCQNIEKASDHDVTFDYSDELYMHGESIAFKRFGASLNQGDLEACVYYELIDKSFIESLLILELQLFSTYTYDDNFNNPIFSKSKLQLNVCGALFLNE